MPTQPTRTRRCGRPDAERRYRQALAFAALAELDPLSTDGPTRSAAVSNAVLAGIAAADAICCRTLGRRHTGDDHHQAQALLTQAGELGNRARSHLETLLSIKNKAQYEQTDPTTAETKRALRAMRSLIDLATSA